jgi:hypothetical protein
MIYTISLRHSLRRFIKYTVQEPVIIATSSS